MQPLIKYYSYCFLLLLFPGEAWSQHVSVIGKGWAGTSINTVVFRKNSVVSYKDLQYAAYYDSSGHVVLAKRKIGTDKWEIKQTDYTGNVKDAHNCISIIVDGSGYLHIAWDHHGNKLRYCQSLQPGSLQLSNELSMTGIHESKVTYPEFYKLSNGDLIFLYRDGASGNGNLVMNHYFLSTKKWEQVQTNLIDGEGKRNAYWQACTDGKGSFHISWVWRESSDVATNHDVCYARSDDGGKTWKRSDGSLYSLPINAANAEYIMHIPQNSELINQTSMCTDAVGDPYIATYWKPAGTTIPQYQLIYWDGKKWSSQQVSAREKAFSLSGAGTKKIPIARPQVLVNGRKVYYLFRDEERNNKVSVFMNDDILQSKVWKVKDLTNENEGQWEPSYDTELWKSKKLLHVFLQRTAQGDGERIEAITAQPVKIVEWKPR
ncbi:MAG: BNR repeat-containing protein [Bacteroidota bacterium]|nr:BNR repeat-containing protein [Bacteroidota bacterium]